MTSYVTPKKNSAFIMYAGLPSVANTSNFQSNPTIASGDFKVSIDGGALANMTNLPTVTPASSKMVQFSLTATEMNGDNITLVCSDAAGGEWKDVIINIQTSARQIDDLAFPATSGRSMVVDAAGLVDANMVKCGPSGSGTAQTAKDIGGAVPAAAAGASGGLLISGSNSGTTTLGALTVTGTATISDGLVVNRSTSNSTAVAFTGSGSGKGMTITGGAGATSTAGGDGLAITGGAGGTTGAPGNGVTIVGGVAGSTSGAAGIGIKATGGAAAAGTGAGAAGLSVTGGAASTTGAAGVGAVVTGGAGAASSNGAASGMTIAGGGTNTVSSTADGLTITGASNGNGVTFTHAGTGKDLNATTTPLTLAKTTNITGFNDLTASAIATGVWQDTTSGDFTVSSSIGKSLYTSGVAPGASGGLFVAGSNAATTVNFTGNLSGSVGSVTGAVTVGTNNDKTGYSLTQTFPTNFSALGISIGGHISNVDTLTTYTGNTPQTGDAYARLGAPAGASVSADVAAINAKTTNLPASPAAVGSAMNLTSAYDFAKGTVAMTESYPTLGATFTPVQALYSITQSLNENSVSGTTMTVKKRDQTTTAKTFTLNDATNPTAITEAS